MNFIDSLNWRYAVKKMDGTQLPEEKIQAVVESIRLAPTSLGVQPFDIQVIKNSELKEKLTPIAYNQPQIKGSSATLVFSIWKDNFEEKIEQYMKNIQETRGVSSESLEDFRKMIAGFLGNKSIEEKRNWAKNQAYIALGVALSCCAVEQIDSTPMEGFDPIKVDELLDLGAKNLQATVLLALGKRDEQTDYLANQKKVRRKKEHMIKEYK